MGVLPSPYRVAHLLARQQRAFHPLRSVGVFSTLAALEFPLCERRSIASPSSASDLGDLLQRHGIHAITQAARGWAIREDVAQMGVTRVADSFDALQKRRPVKPVGNDIRLDGLCERWPARMRLKFLRRIEKDGFATKAGIDSRLKEAAHFRAKGALRSGLPGDMVFLVTKLFTPFGVSFDDLSIRRGVAALRQIQHIGPLEHHLVF